MNDQSPLSRLGLLVGICLLQACSQQTEASRLAGARASLDVKDTASAIVQLKSLLQQHPDSAQGRLLMGRALMDGGDPAAAALELQKARRLNVPADDVVPLLARALLANGKVRETVGEFAGIQLATPAAQAAVMGSLALAYAAQNQMDKADGALASALQADPKNIEARLIQVRRVAAKGDFNQGLTLVAALLAEQPRLVQALLLRGELLAAVGREADAAKAFEDVLAIEPAQVQAHTLLIQSHLRRADSAAFKAQIAKLAKAVPASLEVLFYRTQQALMEDDLQRAKDGVQELLKRLPAHGPVLFLAGSVGLRTGDLELANKHLTQAVSAMPESAGPRRTLAEAQLRGGQSERALATLEPLLADRKVDGETLALAAEAHLQGGDLGRAQALYERAASASPENLRPQVALALTRIARGDHDGGLDRLRSLAPSDRGAYADLALITALLQRNDVAGALQATEALQAKQPGMPLPHLVRARLLRQQNRSAEALASLEKALAADPSYFPAITEITNLDVAHGRYDAARQRLEAFVAKDRRNVQAQLGLIELRRRAGAKPADIEALLLAAVKDFPTEVPVRLALIGHQLEQRQARAALASAQEATAAMPGDARLFDALGTAQMAMGDGQQAIASYRRVIALQPSLPQPHLRLAEVQAAANDYAAAVQSLNAALEVAPSYLPAQRALAQIALLRKRPEDAMKVVAAVRKQRPSDAASYLLEADVQMSNKAFGPAIDALRAALEREPSSDTARRLHGLQSATGRIADAERFAGAWLQKHPRDAEFVFHMGSAAVARGDYVAAEAQYRRVLTLLPDNPRALNNLAMMLLKQNKPGAVAYAEKAVAAAPDEAAVLDTMASALAGADNAGQPASALPWQRKAVERAPDVPAYRLNLARLLIATGDKPQARAELDKLAALGGRFDGHAEVAALLKTL